MNIRRTGMAVAGQKQAWWRHIMGEESLFPVTEPCEACKPLIESRDGRIEQWRLACDARDKTISYISDWIAMKKHEYVTDGNVIDDDDLIALETVIKGHIKKETVRVLKAALATIGNDPLFEAKRQMYEDQLEALERDE
jgi:hypothetical protein